MKQVFIVVSYEGFGGDEIEGVFSTQEAADTFADEKRKDSFHRWRVIRFEVQGT